MRDGLTPLLEELHQADAVAIGSPLYFMAETGMARAFLERYLFQYSVYSDPPGTKFPRRIRNAMIYTMNIPEEAFGMFDVEKLLGMMPGFIDRIIGPCERLLCTDTMQFDDYGKYENSRFDPVAKVRRHREEFPHDEARARELGRRLTEPVS